MTSILIGNIGLENLHGSEIWTWTVSEYLRSKGFEITLLANDIGDFARDYLFDFEVIKSVSGRKFDFGIISHARMLNDIENVRVEQAILVSHGIVDVAIPMTDFHCPHSHVSVSEEVRAHWFNKIGIESSVIANPIRDQWFKLIPGKVGLHAITYANHRHELPAALVEVFKTAGIHIRRIKRGWSQKDVMALIEASEIIIGTGRFIYEAMAAGRRVIIANDILCLGYVTVENYNNRVWYNMTVRNPNANKPDWNKIITDYPKHDPAIMRSISQKEHHVSVIVNKYLELLRQF